MCLHKTDMAALVCHILIRELSQSLDQKFLFLSSAVSDVARNAIQMQNFPYSSASKHFPPSGLLPPRGSVRSTLHTDYTVNCVFSLCVIRPQVLQHHHNFCIRNKSLLGFLKFHVLYTWKLLGVSNSVILNVFVLFSYLSHNQNCLSFLFSMNDDDSEDELEKEEGTLWMLLDKIYICIA